MLGRLVNTIINKIDANLLQLVLSRQIVHLNNNQCIDEHTSLTAVG